LDTQKVKTALRSLPFDFKGFEHRDKLDSYTLERFKTIASPGGYRSIHYIINMQGKYVKLSIGESTVGLSQGYWLKSSSICIKRKHVTTNLMYS